MPYCTISILPTYYLQYILPVNDLSIVVFHQIRYSTQVTQITLWHIYLGIFYPDWANYQRKRSINPSTLLFIHILLSDKHQEYIYIHVGAGHCTVLHMASSCLTFLLHLYCTMYILHLVKHQTLQVCVCRYRTGHTWAMGDD